MLLARCRRFRFQFHKKIWVINHNVDAYILTEVESDDADTIDSKSEELMLPKAAVTSLSAKTDNTCEPEPETMNQQSGPLKRHYLSQNDNLVSPGSPRTTEASSDYDSDETSTGR